MDNAIRVWIDDPNPVFRRGLVASLADPRFVVVGESTRLTPEPDLETVDVLVFDLGEESSALPFTRRRRATTRLVGLVPGWQAGGGPGSQCTILARADLTPDEFRECLASVAGATPRRPAVVAARAGAAAGGWRGVGRGLRRRSALFACAVLVGVTAVGPASRAHGLEDPGAAPAAPVSATPSVETAPVLSSGDAADDAAVWVNPTEPSASTVIGTDKRGALEVYDLGGARLQRLPRPAGWVNNVDLRPGFPLGGHVVDLVGTGGRSMSFFVVEPASRQLVEVGARRFPSRFAEVGFCLYHSAVTERFYAFTVEPDGDVTQWELFDAGGRVDARQVRAWPLGGRAEGCVADDETGRLFVSEEQSGIWRYGAEPDASPLERTGVDRTGGGHLKGDVEGLAVVTQPGRRGFLLASSQGDNTFAVYRRGFDNAWLGQRKVVGGSGVDGCSDTDGIEAVAVNLGPAFPSGIFVCQDGSNTAPGPAGRQNFKFVRLEQVIDASGLPS